ncbi:MAG: hypothetical protein M0Z94_18405, partial [Dehalococcoidales bacterium]|nr:hypothetical protein [Dehalococcoidales bacterium]
QASPTSSGLLGCTLGADGSGAELLMMPAGGSRRPASPETLDNHLHSLKMNGSEVYRFAVDAMAKATKAVVAETGVPLEEVELVIPHQANIRILQAAARSLKLPSEKIFANLASYGNTSSASIPIALCEAIEQGLVHTSDHLLLVGFGAGLTWGAAMVQWGVPPCPAKLPIWRSALHQVHSQFAPVRSASHRLGLRLRTLTSRVDTNGHRASDE